jgi:hypothetical protein
LDASCDAGDAAVGGRFRFVTAGGDDELPDITVFTAGVNPSGGVSRTYGASFRNPLGRTVTYTVHVVCLDLTP